MKFTLDHAIAAVLGAAVALQLVGVGILLLRH